MKRHRVTKKRQAPLAALLFGVSLSFSAIILVSFIASAILFNTKTPIGKVDVASLISLLVAGALSGFAISKKKGEGGIVTASICSATSIAIMLLISLISGSGNIGGKSFMNYVCYILVSVFFAFIGRKREKKHHR